MVGWGAVQQLRFHIGHEHVFDSRGSEHRGHFTSVPLHFPIEGIAYERDGYELQRLLTCFRLVSQFSKLRVLSVYCYHTFSPRYQYAPICYALDLPLISSLPPTLEVLEFRFPYSMVCLLSVRSESGTFGLSSLVSSHNANLAQKQLSDAIQSSRMMYSSVWLPLRTILPNLKTLSLWSDWDTFHDHLTQGFPPQALDKFQSSFLESLPPSLEHMDVDFLLPRTYAISLKEGQLSTLQTLVLRTNTTMYADIFAHLPRNLIRLDVPDRSMSRAVLQRLPTNLAFLSVHSIEDSESGTGPLPFPPHLEKLTTYSDAEWNQDLVFKLPHTLQIFALRKCNVSSVRLFSTVRAPSVVFDRVVHDRPTSKFKIDSFADLNAGVQHFRIASAPALKTDLVVYTPLFPALRSLVLIGCFFNESCLLVLPKTLCLLEVETIRSSGILLHPDTKIVDEAAITSSIRNWCKEHLPLVQAIPPITCVNILHVPYTVEDIRIEYSAVNVFQLTSLTRLAHYSSPLSFPSEQSNLKNLPKSITEIDWEGAPHCLLSATLAHLPKTVTRIVGGMINFGCSLNKNQPPFDFAGRDCKVVSLPDDIAKLADGWTQIELVRARVNYEGHDGRIGALPKNMEELKLHGTGRLAHELTADTLASVAYAGQTLLCDFEQSNLHLHPCLKKVTLICGAAAQYPLSQLPTHLTELNFENHIVNSKLFGQIARFEQLKVLKIQGRVIIQSSDLTSLPSSLTSLSLDVNSLTEDALPYFPTSLTSITLGTRSKLTSDQIRSHLASL